MDSNHFSNLFPPLSPNEKEVSLYEELIGGGTFESSVLLLGYTKELLGLATTALDINPPVPSNPKIKTGDWFNIAEHYDVIIGDGVLNLVGGNLVEHLSKHCSKLIIRFFDEKLERMKYATHFRDNTPMLKPGAEYETQKSCRMLVWNFSNN
jgi:hypothetical protein